MTTVPLGARTGISGVDDLRANDARATWVDAVVDRLMARRDAVVASRRFQRWAAAFPFTRPIARARSSALFDLCAGFVYSQVLRVCVELELFAMLAERPLSPDALAARTAVPRDALDRVLGAAIALRLLERRSRGRIGLGALGAPLASESGLAELVSHHALLYDDLRDPVELLRRRGGADTALATYYPYAAHTNRAPQAEAVAPYSNLMSATAGPLIDEVLGSYSFDRHRVLLDVGGGEGKLAVTIAKRWRHLSATVLDLPAVAERTRRTVIAAGLEDRVAVQGADFRDAALPRGADVVTLVRILLDHGDQTVLDLLRRVRASLDRGGRLLIVEPMAGVRGARHVGDAYFALYLFAMGSGRARTVDELRRLCLEAGFASARRVPTRYPIVASILVAEA